MIEYRQNEAIGDENRSGELARALRIPSAVARILCRRGYDDVQRAEEFLHPGPSQLHDPFLFQGMRGAVDAVERALARGGRICVYGDYDVDGIMAVTILKRYLLGRGGDVIHHIPTRHGEGYGLNMAAMENLAGQGVSLLLTVDCGITALAEVERARELGMEVVVTDHHQCLPELPKCAAVIDPACPLQRYPYRSLCGAGVALKVVQALGGLDACEEYLDCAAIATLADIVPLTGENRAIVAEGLRRINRGECKRGILALLEAAGYGGRAVEAGTISFSIAPRINAAGRTGSPENALALFLSDDPRECRRVAVELDGENKKRQSIEADIYKDALARIAAGEADIVRDRAIILCGGNWNQGVIGIVASRMVERYNKPVILFACEDGICTGSGRSVRGVHLFESLQRFQDMFVRFGGHEMAAGLTIEQSRLEEFKRLYNEYLRETIPAPVFRPKAGYDFEAERGELTLPLAESLRMLEPFGMGNPAPLFRLRETMVRSPRTMGSDGSHLRFSIDGEEGALGCVAFSMGNRMAELTDASVDLLCNLEVNDWRGERKPQCLVRSIRQELPRDFPAFLEENAWKFHDAFFTFSKYNENGPEKMPEPVEDGVALFAGWIQEEQQGCIALCFTPEGAKALLGGLEALGLLDRFDLLFHEAAEERCHNAVLLAPVCKPIAPYRRVLFAGCPPVPCAGLFARCADEAFAQSPGDCRGFLSEAQAAREELIPIYGAMLRLGGSRTSFLTRRAYLDQLEQMLPGMSRARLALGLEVFSELGFIQVSQNGNFSVVPWRNAPKRDLSQSAVFTLAQRALHSLGEDR